MLLKLIGLDFGIQFAASATAGPNARLTTRAALVALTLTVARLRRILRRDKKNTERGATPTHQSQQLSRLPVCTRHAISPYYFRQQPLC